MTASQQIKKLEDQANSLIAEVDALSRRRPDVKVRYITKLTARTKPAKTGYDKTVVQKITWLDNLIADLRGDLATLKAPAASSPSPARPATVKTMTQAEALAEYRQITDPKARERYRKNNAAILGLR